MLDLSALQKQKPPTVSYNEAGTKAKASLKKAAAPTRSSYLVDLSSLKG